MNKFKKIIFRCVFITFAITTIVSCSEKQKFDGYLYPIKENGLYGYIDSVGNRIMEPKFLWLSTFHDGLAMAVVDTIYRSIPDSIAYEVGERDTIVNIFRMYLKYGYIDKAGKFVIKPTFIAYIDMPQIGFVASDMSKCKYILSKYTFHNKRAIYSDTVTWKDGYIDTKGNIIIEARFFYSEPFSEGLAVVGDAVAEPIYTNKACINPSKIRRAYIDTLGNNVTDFKYETLTPFRSGRGVGSFKKINKETIILEDTTFEYETYSQPRFLINKEGQEIKELNFVNVYYGFSKDGISLTSDEFLWKLRGQMSFNYIDIDGNYLEPLKGLTEFQMDSLRRCDDILQVLPDNASIVDATYFGDGFTGISPDSTHWFVMDRYLLIHGYGNMSIFENFMGFNNGLAAVKRNGKWGFINKKIKEQIPCKYDSCGGAYPYLEEIFGYDIQGNVNKIAYINRNDSLVWEGKILKVNEIKNVYSDKEKKDWGIWTYKYNPLYENIQIWIYAALGIIFFIVIIVWGLVRIKASSKQAVMPTNEQSVHMQTNINNITFMTSPIDNATDNEEIRFYPSVGQYTEAIKLASQSPEDYFDELSNLRPVFDANGDPIMSNGNFAVVYKMVDDNGKFHAVRCFHRYQEGRKKSYKLICEELGKVSSPYLSPIKFFENEFYIDSVDYPVILMDWVDGEPLDKYIRKIINDKTKLRSLAENFRQLAIWLLNQQFAHGDLKPDNILVKEDGSLVLVDYDGMFVPAMQGQKARELGSPDFRNPSRTETDFDKNIDNFPIVSILLSLKMIAEKSEYLERFGADDRLLFSYNDYLNLRNSGIYKRAITSYAEDIHELAAMLKRMVSGELCNIESINNLLLKNNWYARMTPNDKFERKIHWFVGVYSILIFLLPLYLRSIFSWHIVMLYITTLFLIALMFLVLVFVDISRPNKKEHINTLGNEGASGCLAWFNFIPLLLMADSFTKRFNDYIPIIEQPYYDDEWYITLLMWIIWWYSNMAIISLPHYLLEWRLKHFKSDEETKTEIIEHELSVIRDEVEKEERIWENRKKHDTCVYLDDFPF